jgi:hypothetical protein
MAQATGGAARSRTTGEPATRHIGGSRGGRPAPGSAQAPARRGSTTFLAGLGIGLAIGAAAALLLAPRSGAETRRALLNRGRKVRNKATDAWEDLRLELDRTTRALKRKRRDARMKVAAAVVKPD